jgi:hypothetical protein
MLLFTTRNRHETENGPLTHSALRAPGLVVGRESRFPPGPLLGSLIVSRPSASKGHAWNPAEQNHTGALARTLGFILSSSRHAVPQLTPTAPLRALSPARAPADGWTRRRRAAPRQSPTRAPQRASDRARRSTSNAEEDGAATGPLAGARVRRWVDVPPSSSTGPYPHGHGGSRVRSRERRLEIYPRDEWIHPQPVVAST